MKNHIPTPVISLLLVIVALALAACQAAPTPGPVAPGEETPVPAPARDPVEAAKQALAQELEIDADSIQIHSFERVQWPDACLGLPDPGEICAQVITPGFEGILIAGDIQYEFRTDARNTQFRFIPGAALSARQVLAQQIRLDPDAIRIQLFERVEWSNACLGVEVAGQMCAEVITPGYRVVLQVGAETYIFHTDETGGNVVLASAPEAQVENPVILWEQAVEGYCERASLAPAGIAFGPCDIPMVHGIYVSPHRPQDLDYFRQKYASFQAETAAGKVTFIGQGTVTVTPAEQRMLAEWARLVDQEASAGRGGASWGLAFAWHREGGLPGFCEDVSVYASGEAYASSCRGNQPQDYGRTLLTANQLAALYSWLDDLKNFEYSYEDPATADAMTIQIVFSGTGQREPADADIQAIQQLSQEILAELSTPQNQPAIQAAVDALKAYFSALHAGRYADAQTYFGGEYEHLSAINPDLDAEDGAALFEAACTRNGFQCLEVRNVVKAVRLSEVDFRVTVEFRQADGNLFVLGPCCGASLEEMLPQSQFDYRVKLLDGEYLVQELPAYVP